MKKIYGYIVTILCVLSLDSFAQTSKSIDNNFDQLIYSKLDYNRLSDDVKQQINKNKLAGVSLFDGVCRAFLVDVSIINSNDDIAKKLSFLYSTNLIDLKYLSGNRIEIITSVETEATFFKEKFLSNNIKANFIDQKFVIYHAK